MFRAKVFNFFILWMTGILLLSAGCGPSRTVQRIGADTTTDLSGRWNDTDSRQTAEAMITDVLGRSWLPAFASGNDRKPVVIVGEVRNLSSEHIPVGTFIKDIERELINSGQVKFVASRQDREEVRDERLEQQSYSSPETTKELARETGADFMMKGTINSIEDKFEGQRVIYYQIDLQLIDLEKNEIVWAGNKKIKKFMEQKGMKW